MLTLDEVTHEYRWHGSIVPSVTQVIGMLKPFAGVPEELLAAACERGTYVHEMCEAYDLGDLDEGAILRTYSGYLDAWKAFLCAHKPNWLAIEEPVYSQRHRLAGTPDRVGSIEHGGVRVTGVFDIKTGVAPSRYWGLQTAAYRQLLMEHDTAMATSARFTIQLSRDGSFRLLPWTDADDWRVMLSLLTIHHWTNK